MACLGLLPGRPKTAWRRYRQRPQAATTTASKSDSCGPSRNTSFMPASASFSRTPPSHPRASPSKPCVGVRSSWWPNASVHIQDCSHGHSGGLHDAADDNAIGKHVEVVVVPLAGRARSCGAFEDEARHRQPRAATMAATMAATAAPAAETMSQSQMSAYTASGGAPSLHVPEGGRGCQGASPSPARCRLR